MNQGLFKETLCIRQFLDLSLSVRDAIEDKADIYVLTKLSSHSLDAAAVSNGVDNEKTAEKRSLLDVLKSAPLSQRFQLPSSVRDESDQDDGLVIANAIQLAHKFISDDNAKEAVIVFNSILEVYPCHKTTCVELARIYGNANRYKEAVKYVKQASASDSSDPELLKQLGSYLLASGEIEEAMKVFACCADRLRSAGADEIDAIKVHIARAQRVSGNEDQALALLSAVLQRKKENVEGLLEYARIVHKKGEIQAKEAMAICVCLMTPKQKDKPFHAFMTEVVEHHGLDLLYQEMKTAVDSAAALAYVATQIRDHGAIKEAALLLKRALDLEPFHTSCALAYIHTLQVLMKYEEAYKFVRQFTVKNSEMAVAGVKCGWFLPLIPEIDVLYMSTVVANEGKVPENFAHSDPKARDPYSAEQLDLVAFYFTLVKILYFSGALELIKPLCSVLDMAHSGRELHLSTIRNENAYFCCISQVIKVPGMYVFGSSDEKPEFIYFAGESHAISPAWRSITYQGRHHVIHPIVATGLKLWHLRPESKFYPKIAFYNAMKRVPNGSTIIFCFGEIDCRDGLTTAVAMCKYETLEEAIAAVINIYVVALKELRIKQKLKVFVHPVVPVLAATRSVVLLFNKMLKERLAKTKHLRYMDFEDALLTGKDLKLKQEYKLDGTHLHPNYLNLIEDTMKM
ncbi:uncharacterized protein LOC134196728 isoform X2 [Corticium candelabrum]|uniref:uncharacterized protein LOC134196728 isoform X2 n=1 Tax=Corticium candelabrum TaxID=121492 RepID=UPI002E274932|nr:uncharacterized protein LOC134196728 isoform X2 [Corticium candelabrum]